VAVGGKTKKGWMRRGIGNFAGSCVKRSMSWEGVGCGKRLRRLRPKSPHCRKITGGFMTKHSLGKGGDAGEGGKRGSREVVAHGERWRTGWGGSSGGAGEGESEKKP